MNINKTILAAVLISILFLVGCSQKCVEREVKYTENEKVLVDKCDNLPAAYEVVNLITKIEPRPNQAQRQYDSGYARFTLLNKDVNLNGYFNTTIECVMPDGNTKETQTINLQGGERKDSIQIMCSKRGTILSITGPVIDPPSIKKCSKVTEEKPVEKTRKETVCN